MAKVESLKCPECGGPLHFEKDQEYCFCSHCGHQVYKEDVHYDKKLDVSKELELAKIRKEENETKIGLIAATIMFIAIFIFLGVWVLIL